MSIDRQDVYLPPSIASYRLCSLSDISSYTSHLYTFFESSAFACPTNTALEIGNEKISYETLMRKVDLCSVGFYALGVESGDVMVFSMKKSTALVVSILAAFKRGAKICVLPPVVSASRLRSIQQAIQIDFFLSESGNSLNDCTDMGVFLPRTFSYDQVMESGIYKDFETTTEHAFLTTSQIVIQYDVDKGLYPVEFSQAYFFQAMTELETIFLHSQPKQKIITQAAVTQPKFLLDLFYAFSRQLTCVLIEDINQSFVSKVNAREIEMHGLPVSFEEIEYFARQYPGVMQANAEFTSEGLELRVRFSWDFYPSAYIQHVSAACLLSPKNEGDRLACRLFYFLTQHLWVGLPIVSIVLQPLSVTSR